MNKFLYRLIAFIVLAFVTQYAVYMAFKYVLDKKSDFRISRYFRAPKHKYFVIGDSRGANSIDEKYATEALKIDIINLSFNGMPYKNSLDMLDQVNRDNTNSTIFFEISCLADNDFDGAYSYYSSNSDIFKKRYAETIYNLPTLLRLNNEFFLRNIYYLRKSDNDWINMGTITQNVINQISRDSSYKMFPNINEFHQRLALLQKKMCRSRK